MSTRPDGLPVGPRRPLAATPPRRPGSVRRTTAIDQHRGDPGAPQRVVATGRDLRTTADGGAEVLDGARFEARIDPDTTVGAIESDPPVPELTGLVGHSARHRVRGRIDGLLPDHAERASVLHQLLDDLPMAWLISSYGSSREQPDFRLPLERAEAMQDLCAGWEAGGTMLATLRGTGRFPIPVGPPAPDLSDPDDPLAWHDLPALPPRSVRRRRRLDVWAGPTGDLEVDAHFRDSHVDADGVEDVLHEYTVRATVDPASLRVRTAAAEARVLPWPECPGALASAGRIEGQRLTALRMAVTVRFTGTSTCTHLNDTLRSLAGVVALAPAVDAPGGPVR